MKKENAMKKKEELGRTCALASKRFLYKEAEEACRKPEMMSLSHLCVSLLSSSSLKLGP
jgi:hypothetical protein